MPDGLAADNPNLFTDYWCLIRLQNPALARYDGVIWKRRFYSKTRQMFFANIMPRDLKTQ